MCMKNEKKNFRDVWNGIELSSSPIETIETDNAFARFSKNRFRRIIRSAVAIAAAIIIPCVLTIGIISTVGRHSVEEDIALMEVSTDRGEIQEVVLPDGTTILLNSSSRVVFPSRFTGSERTIIFEGEGLFQVSSDESHPFIVKSGHCFVKVLGTRFNLESYKNEGFAEVALYEGSVQFGYQDSKGEFRTSPMKPSDVLTYDSKNYSISKRVFDKDIYSIWKDGNYYFRNQPFRVILSTLERVYDVKFILRDPNMGDKLYHLAIVSGQTIDDVVDLLNMDSRLHAKRSGNIIEIN